LLCRICNKPVSIETAFTDGDGKTVHGDCFVHRIQDHDGHMKEEKRSWSAIAKELSQEQDPGKVGELANELNDALDQAEAERHPPIQKSRSQPEDLNMSNRRAPHCAQCGQELELVIDARTGKLTVRECANPACPSKEVRNVPQRSPKDPPTAA
jgi:hypothetical protein